MNKGDLGTAGNLQTKRFFHGTRAELKPGDLIEPSNPLDVGERDRIATYVYLTPNLDEAIWDTEIAVGEGPGRVYVEAPLGQIGDAPDVGGRKSVGQPSMSCCSREPLRVTREVIEWTLYHGTRVDLEAGDLIGSGYSSNYGKRKKGKLRLPDCHTGCSHLGRGAGRW